MPVSSRRFIAPRLIGFVIAALTASGLPLLPSQAALVVIAAAGVAAFAHPRFALVGGALLGYAWVATAAQHGLTHRIAPCVDGGVFELRGAVVGLPKFSALQTQFDVRPEAIEPWPACAGPLPRRLRLSWFDGPPPASGETWHVSLRLRGIRGFQNPGGFDYEGWAFANRIDGGGSVRYGVRVAEAAEPSWDRARSWLRTRISALQLAHGGIVLGLLTGDGGMISDADWALFRATGTVHLMVISGLHLAIAAGIGSAVGRGFARLFPRLLRCHGAAWLGVVFAVVFVTLYAGLAGWGVPVQRSWLATVLVLLASTRGRRYSLPLMFWSVCAGVLVFDPLAPLQAGFWLSFGAVAILLAHFAPRYAPKSAARTLVVAQIVLGCAMVPLLLATIGGIAWLGPIANLVAVPLISAVAVPLDLLAALALGVSADLGIWLFGVVDVVVGVVMAFLRALATFDWSAWRADFGLPALLLSGITCGLWLLPIPLRYRLLVLPCLLLPAWLVESAPNESHFRVAVLDVGQGSAVIIDTARHRLLYDAGPRFPTGLDLGSAVVVPALRHTGVSRLDLAILSHADIDHAGGAAAVAGALPVRVWLGGEPVPGLADLRSCHGGKGWQWDGVRFQILRLPTEQMSDNDRSCVLLIDNGRRRVLLPGDISRNGELAVLPQLIGKRLDVLLAAHHGSRSSSTTALLRAGMPPVVAVSAGHRNRFGHPHKDVVCRFTGAGARVFSTSQSGALVWRSEQPSRLREWRLETRPYWRVAKSEAQTTCHAN
jgi:competence protein ComEC